MRIALALGLCLLAFAATAAPRAKTDKPQLPQIETPAPPVKSPNLRENYRSRLNENVVTIMAASPSETDLTIATEIAQVVDDGDNLRVLPIVGRGVAQNVKDVLFMRGVDMGITQANVLKHYAKTGELGANFIDQVVYVAKLFNEEVHIVVRSDVTDIRQLKGKVVNLGTAGSGTAITGRLLLDDLGIQVQESRFQRRRRHREAEVGRDCRRSVHGRQARAGDGLAQGQRRLEAAFHSLHQRARGRVLSGQPHP